MLTIEPSLPTIAALRAWDRRTIVVAIAASVGVALLIGLATVLIPNPVFGRDIPPVWWNYPVWLVTSLLTGMLLATYVSSGEPNAEEPKSTSATVGWLGTMLAWFAVGCPVCNKIALLALGYSGALTWFAPLQPLLALLALALTAWALVVRLRGQVSCPADGTRP